MRSLTGLCLVRGHKGKNPEQAKSSGSARLKVPIQSRNPDWVFKNDCGKPDIRRPARRSRFSAKSQQQCRFSHSLGRGKQHKSFRGGEFGGFRQLGFIE
jgi:hypothetical protein